MEITLKENERIDDLEFKNLKIIQNKEGFCFGIDSVLLSDFAKTISNNSKVIDLESNEEYALVDIEDAVGEFIGTVRSEYDKVINRFIKECTNCFSPIFLKFNFSYIVYEESFNDEYKLQFYFT